MSNSSRKCCVPSPLTTTSPLEKATGGGLRFQGIPKHYDYTNNLIVSKDRDLLDRDFVFEVLITFSPNDGVGHIGFGSGRQEGSANRRENSAFIRFHSPDQGDGEVQVAMSGKEPAKLGTVPQKGVHRVVVSKEGPALTFLIDPENDGPSDDDLETVIPDISEVLPGINSKNSSVFIGGTATYVGTQFTKN